MQGAALPMMLGLAAGIVVACQGPINAELARNVGSPLVASTISFVAGAIGLAIVSLIVVKASGTAIDWRAPPLWQYWLGGCLGAFFITTIVILTPTLGIATVLAVAFAGQLVAGLLIDHYGLLGLAVREVTAWRIAGAGFLVVGAFMMRPA